MKLSLERSSSSKTRERALPGTPNLFKRRIYRREIVVIGIETFQ